MTGSSTELRGSETIPNRVRVRMEVEGPYLMDRLRKLGLMTIIDGVYKRVGCHDITFTPESSQEDRQHAIDVLKDKFEAEVVEDAV